MLKMSARSKIIVFSSVLAVLLVTTSATSVLAASSSASKPANHDLAAIWGSQFRELQVDRAIYDRLKLHSLQIKDASKPLKTQRYLNEFAFALRQAESIIRSSSPSSTATVKVNNRFERGLTSEQEIAMYLHMIRGIRAKLGISM